MLPEWQDAARGDHARMLLAHDSGMNSGADYRTMLGENVERFALERDLVAEPGERVIYSDLGFIALGALLERIAGTSFPSLAARTFAAAAGFSPAGRERAAIPATEEDAWRGRVQGFVHDEKAYLMGGVAGHAGLFGTAGDVAADRGVSWRRCAAARCVAAGRRCARSDARTGVRSGAAARPRLGAEDER